MNEILRLTPLALRERIYANLYNLPEGIPPGRLSELSQYLTPFFANLSVVLRPESQLTSTKSLVLRLKTNGVNVFGIEMPRNPTRAFFDWAKSITSLGIENGLVAIATQVRKWTDVQELKDYGVLLISGPVLGQLEETLPSVRPLTSEEVNFLSSEKTASLESRFDLV